MEFDRLLEAFDDETGEKEEVALIFYFLETFEEENDITLTDIKEIIRRSRSTINPRNVSTYITRLENDDKWVTIAENEGYRLSKAGIRGVEDLLDAETLENHRDVDDKFIDTDVIEDERYEMLVTDINECYRYRIYDASMVLTRKFFEDLVFQILKTHYAGKDTEMFYDQENNRHYSFAGLLNNLREGVPTLRQYSRDLDRQLVEELRDLKEAGNEGAHSVQVDFTDEEIESWSSDATQIAEVLYDVLHGARIADETA